MNEFPQRRSAQLHASLSTGSRWSASQVMLLLPSVTYMWAPSVGLVFFLVGTKTEANGDRDFGGLLGSSDSPVAPPPDHKYCLPPLGASSTTVGENRAVPSKGIGQSEVRINIRRSLSSSMPPVGPRCATRGVHW
jgi:hypothetical protein